MYVGLFVRDVCERSVKNQASKDESIEFTSSSREATHEKAMCEVNDWKLKSRARLTSSREEPPREVPAKVSIWQKVVLLYQILYPHYKYPHYLQIVKSYFQRENPSKYT